MHYSEHRYMGKGHAHLHLQITFAAIVCTLTDPAGRVRKSYGLCASTSRTRTAGWHFSPLFNQVPSCNPIDPPIRCGVQHGFP